MAVEVSETRYKKRGEMTGRTFEVTRPWSTTLVSRQYGKVDIIIQPQNETEEPRVQLLAYREDQRIVYPHGARLYTPRQVVADLRGPEINTLDPFVGRRGKRLVSLKYREPEAKK